jgi:hypothetical protein
LRAMAARAVQDKAAARQARRCPVSVGVADQA